MKKYEKPAIEIVEANLSTDCLDDMGMSSGQIGGGETAPSRKNKDYEEDDDFGEDW